MVGSVSGRLGPDLNPGLKFKDLFLTFFWRKYGTCYKY
jgi:hypothetical protein